MASQLILPHLLDANGDPVSGGKAYVYETGTTTPVTVYTDTALSVAHANPIVADSAGRFAQAFYGGSTALKVVLTTSADATIDTLDPVALAAVSTSTAASVSYSPVTGNAATNLQDAVDNLVDGTATFQAFTSASGGVIGIEDIETADKTGADLTLVTGTAGTSGNVATWNADGDLVDGGRAPGAMDFIASQDASASATLDFTGFDATKYDAYVFELMNIVPDTDLTDLRMRTSTDGGATYDSGATDYAWGSARTLYFTGGTEERDGSATATFIQLADAIGSDPGETGVSGTVRVHGPHLAAATHVTANLSYQQGGGYELTNSGGVRVAAADVDAVRFLFSSGNIESGTITMYGLRNS